jgi:hypothetical protein
MPPELELPARAKQILTLARKDRAGAKGALAALSVDEQVALVCETPVSRRAELLDLLHAPEHVIPALPDAELCFTVKAIGLADAGWLMAYATEDQIQTCVDLDAWSLDETPDRARLSEWLAAMIEAGDDALLRSVHALDAELLMLWLADRLHVHLKPNDDPGWQPPAGGRTLEGQFYLIPRRADDAIEDVFRLLGLLFSEDYWLYFRLLQSVSWESTPENEEFALRWRTGRLQDLGFPPRDEAITIYAAPRREELELLPDVAAETPGEWHLPVWMPELPASADLELSLFRAAGELDPVARRAFFYAFVALANQVAVSDRLPLGDAESLPTAIEKAARTASRGLDWLAERHGLAHVETLRRAPLVRLSRVGSRIDRGDPDGAPRLDPDGASS